MIYFESDMFIKGHRTFSKQKENKGKHYIKVECRKYKEDAVWASNYETMTNHSSRAKIVKKRNWSNNKRDVRVTYLGDI